jgi:NTE family protein
MGLKPAAIAGTSIGAIIGACYASGMSGREMRELAIEFFSDRRGVMTRLWKIRPLLFKHLMRGRIGAQFDAEAALKQFVPGLERVPETFEELSIPLKIIACDFYGWTESVLETGAIRPALAGSIAMPSVFKPVLVNGRLQIDGGAFNPLPFDHVSDCDVVIACDVTGGPVGEPDRVPSMLETIIGAAQVSIQAITHEKLKWHQPDILVRPHCNGIFVLDFLKTEWLLEQNAGLKDDIKRRLEHIIDSPFETLPKRLVSMMQRRVGNNTRKRAAEVLSPIPE